MRFLLIGCLLMLSACAETPFETWISNQHQRCMAMGGTHHFDRTTNTFECFRHPVGRMTKELFSTKYDGLK